MAIKTSTDLIIPPAHALGVPSDVDYALRTRVVRIKTVEDPAATPMTAPEHLLFVTEVPIIITSCNILPQATVAFNGVNFATFALNTGNVAGGALGGTPLGSRSTAAVSLTANTIASVASGLNAAVAANQRVSLAVSKAGGGVQVGVNLVEVTYQLA